MLPFALSSDKQPFLSCHFIAIVARSHLSPATTGTIQSLAVLLLPARESIQERDGTPEALHSNICTLVEGFDHAVRVHLLPKDPWVGNEFK